MTSVGGLLEIGPIAAVAAAVAAVVATLVVRSFRRAARASSPDALRLVLDPAAVAEQTEQEFTTMLRDGDLTQAQYRTLIGALAADYSSIRRPAPSTAQDHRQAS